MHHVLIHCPRHERASLLVACGTERLDDILMRPECAKHAARWLVRAGIMDQFRVAAEIAWEKTGEYRAFQRQKNGKEARPSDILGVRLIGYQKHKRSTGCACET